ncbi:alpha/beta hydrolase [Picrophilus oshimae]|uniref:Acetyl esterase n=1 Tax=Picrophilus torridus (strain ATCC 700027 / DSM 9790 / JCM 10055 / NBRC 100828 / KAW 2/3) TaxID=1122961 RepID=A0A8G2FWU7_PICTO|nr:alpha/beta hydrolase [Picrophilus oshimae]SMD30962.1 acetyl esterase [Picrophilus oshimae DSM 9789]
MIDPEIKEIIENTRPLNPADIKIDEFRALMDNLAIEMSREKIKVREVIDIKINNIKSRLYNDSDSDGIIIYMHGGGFVFGSIESYDNICRYIAKCSGLKVLSVDYRLAPENKFPAALDDSFEAFKYVYDHYSDLRIKMDRICLAGDSAGGNLAASLSLKIYDELGVKPGLDVLFYPSLAPDTFSRSFSEYNDGPVLTGDLIQWFGSQYYKNFYDILNPYFSPMLGDLSKMPESIVVTAEYDPLRDQGESYLKMLRKANVRATGIRSLMMVHGFATDFEYVSAARNILFMVYSLAGNIINKL